MLTALKGEFSTETNSICFDWSNWIFNSDNLNGLGKENEASSMCVKRKYGEPFVIWQ